jgi:DNA modification methylase
VPAGCKAKDLIGIPWMLAFALRADGWYLRQEIIWAKGTSGARREGNVMPESVRDRCTKAHEQLFLLSKRPSYYFDADAIKEPAQDWGPRDRSQFRGGTDDPKLKHHGLANGSIEMGNRRSVWRVNPTPYRGAHFATFPPALIEPCVLAGSRPGDTVLDPFMGSGTTAGVALKLGRQYVGCELNPEYRELQVDRIARIA